MNLAAFWRNQKAFKFVPCLHPLGDLFSWHDALPAFVLLPALYNGLYTSSGPKRLRASRFRAGGYPGLSCRVAKSFRGQGHDVAFV